MRKTTDAVPLTEDARARRRTRIGRGSAPARALTHARLLLQATPGEGSPAGADAAIAGARAVHPAPVGRVRRASVTDGWDAALARTARHRVYARALDGAAAAHVVALAGGAPPPGRARWTLQLLADALVRLAVVEAVSYETVRRT